MGAGKTSIGRRVAKMLGVSFVDSDAAIARAHGPIERIFAEQGEARFRELERDAVAEALDAGGVVALGGGAVMDAGTRALLGGHRVVLLTVEPRIVASRIQGTNRPLLQADDPVGRWREIYEARRPVYEELADATFDTSHGPLGAVAEAIAAWVGGSPGDGTDGGVTQDEEDEEGAQ
ncbi:shikimate kinase [Microbacterium sp. ASV49]|uniref:Shikimate kinase n=1 Tax=Microbacterium candidum TaxID=3041922 RepID=A0ABT7MZ89_9MICO|nr:shikimate kinase [Microbacterium sp. ASV49]MDL9979768.1 shikimate kinase [Microbacterium sp. ASV49]